LNKGLALLLALICFLIAGIVYLKERSKPEPVAVASSTEPVYDWANVWDRELGIQVGGPSSLKITRSTRVRFSLTARYPLNVGLVPAQKVDNTTIASIDLGALNCSEGSTAEATRECAVPDSESTLVLLYDGSSPYGKQTGQIIKLKIDALVCKANCPQN
jgi:hypothetical protein